MKNFPLISSHQGIKYKYLLLTIFTVISTTYSPLIFSTHAIAQKLPSTREMKNYAETLLIMEPIRQETLEKIKKMLSNGRRSLPIIACNDKNSINNLPNKARVVVVNFCQSYQSIVSENEMTIERFNQITDIINRNEEVQNDMYKLLIEKQYD